MDTGGDDTPARRRRHEDVTPGRSENPIAILQQALQTMNRQIGGQLQGISVKIKQLKGAALSAQQVQGAQEQRIHDIEGAVEAMRGSAEKAIGDFW